MFKRVVFIQAGLELARFFIENKVYWAKILETGSWSFLLPQRWKQQFVQTNVNPEKETRKGGSYGKEIFYRIIPAALYRRN